MTDGLYNPGFARRNAAAALILGMLPGKTTYELADEIGKRSSAFSTNPAERRFQVHMSLFDLLRRQPPRVQYNQRKGEAGRWFPYGH